MSAGEAKPIPPFKRGPTIPLPSHIFDECVSCGQPIEGRAVVSGADLAWHEECFLPPFEPTSFIDLAD